MLARYVVGTPFSRAIAYAAFAMLLIIGEVYAEPGAEPGRAGPGDHDAMIGGGLFDSLEQMRPATPESTPEPAQPSSLPDAARIKTPQPAADGPPRVTPDQPPVPRPVGESPSADATPAEPPVEKPATAGAVEAPPLSARPAARPQQGVKPRRPASPERSRSQVASQPQDNGSRGWQIHRGEAAGWRIIR